MSRNVRTGTTVRALKEEFPELADDLDKLPGPQPVRNVKSNAYRRQFGAEANGQKPSKNRSR